MCFNILVCTTYCACVNYIVLSIFCKVGGNPLYLDQGLNSSPLFQGWGAQTS